jgi:thiol:disulfide interchange protein DsbD
MKSYVAILALLVISLPGFCQSESPVKWSFESRKKSSHVYEIVLHATVAEPWHIYSQFTPDGGPLATEIIFASNPIIVMDGSPKEVGKLLTQYDKNFGVDVRYFSNSVDFVQTIKPRSAVRTSVRGNIEYMVCNDTKCLPPVKQSFTVEIQ